MRNKAILAGVLVLGLLACAPMAFSDEWINLFDKETLFGLHPYGDSQWKVADGNLVWDSGTCGWIATGAQFSDFELKAKIKVVPGCSAGLVVRGGLEGAPSENGSTVLTITEPKDGKGDWREITVTASGKDVKVDGADVQVTKGTRTRGYIGVLFYRSSKDKIAEVTVESLKLRPLNTKSIFNGKDLSGWNVIPEKKSVFSVIDGALNIKNGNGQIETADTYKDFLVQLDIFSNGDHLNSGVFFRGPVGVFWKGYESQVRNEWEGEDRTKPVDFGTGGLYGDQASRKVVSTDREWFTKTIVCDGNHIAVWLNGYQVTDYLDMRPVSADANGKAGYVANAGTIHLQGHDPTTDLSFKNIVVQRYPEK